MKGKENKLSVIQKQGIYGKEVPISKDDKTIWIHCASYGEVNSIKLFIDILLKKLPEHKILLTTCSLSSQALVNERYKDNNRVHHAFAPLDKKSYVASFLLRFRPEKIIFTEQEIWPNAIIMSHKVTKDIFLLNVRMSPRTVSMWSNRKKSAKFVFSHFKAITCQTKRLNTFFTKTLELKNSVAMGNIKYDNHPPELDKQKLEEIKEQINDRVTLTVLSTHPEEEEIIVNLHKKLQTKFPSLLTILLPRHINRIPEIEKMFQKNGISYAIRSRGAKVKFRDDIYLADTMGEVLYFSSLANITIVGGSFKKGVVGGHNILEPAMMNNVVVTGDEYFNYQETVGEMIEKDAIVIVNEETINDEMMKLFLDKDKQEDLRLNASAYYQDCIGVTEKVVKLILS